MNIPIKELRELTQDEIAKWLDRRPASDPTVQSTCKRVIESVRVEGDEAVVRFTQAFDAVDLRPDQLRVTADEFESAESTTTQEVLAAIEHAQANISRFHEAQRPEQDRWQEIEAGVWCGERSTPIETVCLYVPRGRGAFVSVACMLGIPARIAGVRRIIVCTPPGPDGVVDAATLVACKRMGISEVYRIGGAQAVAAVAFGTRSIPRCDKIVGPGNVYVSAAKRLLSHEIDAGLPAGPSESLILADQTANPDNVAWNLLIEAEHGENSAALLVTHSLRLAENVAAALPNSLQEMTARRRDYAATSLATKGGILLTRDLDESIAFANRFAAEHVALMTADPWSVHPRLTNAGEIIFGDYPIISLANYGMGMNAILPTGSAVRTDSRVSVGDFMKVTSLGFCTGTGFERLVPVVSALSRDEGFSAHHLAVEQWTDTAGSRMPK